MEHFGEKMELLKFSKFKLQLRTLITEVRELRVRIIVVFNTSLSLSLIGFWWIHISRKRNVLPPSNFVFLFRLNLKINLNSFFQIAFYFFVLMKCLETETKANRGRIWEEITGSAGWISFLQWAAPKTWKRGSSNYVKMFAADVFVEMLDRDHSQCDFNWAVPPSFF